MAEQQPRTLLKEQFFNKNEVTYLADLFYAITPSFNRETFIAQCTEGFPSRELLERAYWVRENLEKQLPDNYQEALAILLKIVVTVSEEKKGDYIFLSFLDFVAKRGCTKEHLQLSLHALGELTPYFSAEFAIRPFINTFPKETFCQMEKWSLSKNEHRRRLASEGLRPHLPWAKAITFDYKQGSSLLDNLFSDQERYVTRSVANHLNDISKFNITFVLEKLTQWKLSQKQHAKEMDYIIRHTLRTSIKRGDPQTLSFLGYKTDPAIELQNLAISHKELQIGETQNISFTILAHKKESLIVDYKITYPTPTPKTTKRVSQKVFKIGTWELDSGQSITINKKHTFKLMTTKKLYPGTYTVEIQINGQIKGESSFKMHIP